MMLPNVTSSFSAAGSTAARIASSPPIFGARVRRKASSSRLVSAAGSFRPAPCKIAVTAPSPALTSPIAAATSAAEVTSALT